jgi:hypothetical protein
MQINQKRKTLIDNLFEIVGSCVERNDYYSARLFQRDLILLMTQDPRYSKSQVSSAYFALAEFCAKVNDFRSVNKFSNRAAKYKHIASQGKVGGLGKLIQDRNKSLKDTVEQIVSEPGQRFLQTAFRSI